MESETIEWIDISDIGYINKLKFNPSDDNKIFMYGRGGNNNRSKDIYSLDLTSGLSENLTINLTTLDNKPPHLNNLAVSPSGNYIAFTALISNNSSNNGSYEDQKTEIYMLDVSTKEVTRLTNGIDGWEGELGWID